MITGLAIFCLILIVALAAVSYLLFISRLEAKRLKWQLFRLQRDYNELEFECSRELAPPNKDNKVIYDPETLH